MSSWGRKRWAAVTAAACGSAATLYYIYNKWDEWERLKAARADLGLHDGDATGAHQHEIQLQSPETAASTPQPIPEATLQQDADKHLFTHFDSVQTISTTTTTPSLLPMLLQSLIRNTDYKPLLDQLRRGGLSGDEKHALWSEIKVLTFSRAIAASWMVSLLDLMNRVQLNILGRHLYLQSNVLDTRHPQHGSLSTQQHPAQITQRAQELFLAYAHFCGERGVEPLIPIIKQAVIDAISTLDLSTKLDADQVLQVLSNVHRQVAPKLAGLGFEIFLLPSPEHREVWHSAARFPDNSFLQQGSSGSPDDEAIDGLVTEVRQVICSAKFGAALKAAVQESARIAAHELQKEVGSDRRPLAKLCPRVAELASKLLQRDDNVCVSRFAVLSEVQRLSATVYSYGLHA